MSAEKKLPAGWEVKRLGDLFEITSSKRVFQSEWKKSGIPFYRAREIVKLAKDGSVNNELFISEEMYKTYSERYGIPQVNDIMVTGVGTLGICYIVKENDKFYFKDGNIIWLKSRGLINSRYVEYAFKSDILRKQIDDSVGATVATYTIEKANRTILAVPPLSEQKRIVAILDEAFQAIGKAKENAQKNLANARELFEGYLNQVFSNPGKDWEEKKLGEITVSISTGPFGTMLHKSDYVEEGIPLINPVSIINMRIVPSEKMQVSEETRERLHAYVLHKGDIIIGRRGDLGRCALITEKENGWLCGTGSFFLRLNDRVDNAFFIRYFSSEQMKNKLLKLSVGTTMNNLNHKILRDLVVPVPPLKVQKEINLRFELLGNEIQRLESIYTKKLAALDELKKSILQKAFSGEL
jgi:type I restriction enzyme S subunit